MIRFVPDTWVEALLRPFLMADPVAGLYAEIHAPDLRFALLLLGLGGVVLARRSLRVLDGAQARTALGLALAFYLWTLVSGNARYFLWGLMIVGPLVVVVARRLPGTQTLRNTLVLGCVALQAGVVWMTFEPNAWALRPWAQGGAFALERRALSDKPAVFVTVGAISHSILVPQMHPLSRWANIGGQQDLQPGMRDHDRLQQLLDSPLPKYGVIRANQLVMDSRQQPNEAAWAIVQRVMERQGLVPRRQSCIFERIVVDGLPEVPGKTWGRSNGFWFCEIERGSAAQAGPRAWTAFAPELDDVFERVERQCPRYFPPGDAATRPGDEGAVRHYAHSDTTLTVHHSGVVYFKHMRALNPTEVARVDELRAGRFRLDCARLPGRYVPPWARGWNVELE